MGWFSNIKIVKEMKENKAVYSLTAQIEDVFNLSEWRIKDLVEKEIVQEIARQLKHKYVEDLVQGISVEEVRKQALTAFKDDIRESFKKER